MDNIIDAFKYRDCPVIIGLDDYGQSYQYEIHHHGQKIFEGGCGTYNPDYRAEVEWIIDDFFDHIHSYPKWHGSTKFLNHEHTVIGLYYCGELVVTYEVTPIHSVKEILQIAAQELKNKYEKDFDTKNNQIELRAQ